MSDCVNEPQDLSFPCIMSIVSDVRSGNITTETFRKVLKQVDNGLAKFGKPDASILSIESEQEVCDKIEQYINSDVTAQNPMLLISMLLTILRLLNK